eukprot:gene9789-10825_t
MAKATNQIAMIRLAAELRVHIPEESVSCHTKWDTLYHRLCDLHLHDKQQGRLPRRAALEGVYHRMIEEVEKKYGRLLSSTLKPLESGAKEEEVCLYRMLLERRAHAQRIASKGQKKKELPAASNPPSDGPVSITSDCFNGGKAIEASQATVSLALTPTVPKRKRGRPPKSSRVDPSAERDSLLSSSDPALVIAYKELLAMERQLTVRADELCHEYESLSTSFLELGEVRGHKRWRSSGT